MGEGGGGVGSDAAGGAAPFGSDWRLQALGVLEAEAGQYADARKYFKDGLEVPPPFSSSPFLLILSPFSLLLVRITITISMCIIYESYYLSQVKLLASVSPCHRSDIAPKGRVVGVDAPLSLAPPLHAEWPKHANLSGH